jgi:hypothetical protein
VLLRTVIRSRRSSALVAVESSVACPLSKSRASNLASRISQVFKRHSASTAAKEKRPSKKWTSVFSTGDMPASKRRSASAHERDYSISLTLNRNVAKDHPSFFLFVLIVHLALHDTRVVSRTVCSDDTELISLVSLISLISLVSLVSLVLLRQVLRT